MSPAVTAHERHTGEHHRLQLLLVLSLLHLLSPSLQQLLPAVCTDNFDCGYEHYCRYTSFVTHGHCSACWKCCLFSRQFGSCPDMCMCASAAGTVCSASATCGAGMFCRVGSLQDAGTCQPCTSCLDNSDSAEGNCSASCPTGAMHQLMHDWPLQQQEQLVYLQFSAADTFQDSQAWDFHSFQTWITGGLAAAAEAQNSLTTSAMLSMFNTSYAFQVFDVNRDGRVSLQEWVLTSLTTSVTSLICRNEDGNMPQVTSPGCPCRLDITRASQLASAGRCPAGYTCTPQPLQGHSGFAGWTWPVDPATDMLAVCVQCLAGQYCAEGSITQVTSSTADYDCPTGSFCPSAASQLPCPAGHFCPPGSQQAITCDLASPYGTAWAATIVETSTVLQRLQAGDGQLSGNYCPMNASTPTRICQAGYYCPKPSQELLCPSGSYCPPGSSHTRSCKPLTTCHQGTVKPPCSWLAVLWLGLDILVALLLWRVLILVDAGTWQVCGVQGDHSDINSDVAMDIKHWLNQGPTPVSGGRPLVSTRYGLCENVLTSTATAAFSHPLGEGLEHSSDKALEASNTAATALEDVHAAIPWQPNSPNQGSDVTNKGVKGMLSPSSSVAQLDTLDAAYVMSYKSTECQGEDTEAIMQLGPQAGMSMAAARSHTDVAAAATGWQTIEPATSMNSDIDISIVRHIPANLVQQQRNAMPGGMTADSLQQLRAAYAASGQYDRLQDVLYVEQRQQSPVGMNKVQQQQQGPTHESGSKALLHHIVPMFTKHNRRTDASYQFEEDLLQVQRSCRSAASFAQARSPSYQQSASSMQWGQQGQQQQLTSPRQQSRFVVDGQKQARSSCNDSKAMQPATQLEAASPNNLSTTGEPLARVDFAVEAMYIQQNRAEKPQLVLGNLQGSFEPYSLSMLLGPSGCGKSTLLDVLRGRIPLQQQGRPSRDWRHVFTQGAVHGTGLVAYNGLPVGAAPLHKIIGFVPQDDILLGDLTVRENLLFSAALKLPASMDSTARSAVVQDILDLLNLTSVQASLVGSVEQRGVSGGQRKRVNIGVELVARPSVLYLDEPTSGLDAHACVSITRGLRLISQRGMTVLAVLHQPSYAIFRMFHQCLLLPHGSGLVFAGPPLLAAPYFESMGFRRLPNENPADWLMDIVAGTAVQQTTDGHYCVTTDAGQQLTSVWQDSGNVWVGQAASLNGSELQQQQASAGGDLPLAAVQYLHQRLQAAMPDGHRQLPGTELIRLLSEPDAWGALGFTAEDVQRLLERLGLDEALFLSGKLIELALVAQTGCTAADDLQLQLPAWRPGAGAAAAVQQLQPAKSAGPVLSTHEESSADQNKAAHGMQAGSLPVHDSTLPGSTVVGRDGMYAAHRQETFLEHDKHQLHEQPATRHHDQACSSGSVSGPMLKSRALLLSRAGSVSSTTSGTPLGLTGISTSPTSATVRMPSVLRCDSAKSSDDNTASTPTRLVDAPSSSSSPRHMNSPRHVTSPKHISSPKHGPLPLRPHTCLAAAGAGGMTVGWQLHRPYSPLGTSQLAQEQKEDTLIARSHSCPMLQAQLPASQLNADDSVGDDCAAEEPQQLLYSASHIQATPSAVQKSVSKVLSPSFVRSRLSPKRLPSGWPAEDFEGCWLAAAAHSQHSTNSEGQHQLAKQPQSPKLSRQQSAATSTLAGPASPPAQRDRPIASQPAAQGASHGHLPGDLDDLASGPQLRQQSFVGRLASYLEGPMRAMSDRLMTLASGSAVGLMAAADLKKLQQEMEEKQQREQSKQMTLLHLNSRQQPPAGWQLLHLLRRGLLRQRRLWTCFGLPAPFIDMLLLLMAGLIVGAMHSGVTDLAAVPQQVLMSMTTLGVLSSVIHLRTFSANRQLLLREVTSGIRLTAFFMAQGLVDMLLVVVVPAVYLSVYYYLVLPEMPYQAYFAAAVGVTWWLSGLAYLVAAVLPSRSTLMAGVLMALVFGAFINGTNPSIAAARAAAAPMHSMDEAAAATMDGTGQTTAAVASPLMAALSLSYNRWAMEALSLAEFRQWGKDRRTLILSVSRGLGLCRLDALLPDDGDGVLSEREALAYLQVQEQWSSSFCDGARETAQWALVLGGAVLRVTALMLLHLTHLCKFWHS